VLLRPFEFAEPLLELSSTTAIKAAVIEGMGPAVLGAHTVAVELAAGTLVGVDVAGVDLGDRQLRWSGGRPIAPGSRGGPRCDRRAGA
jgi:DNA-binding transcriptional LysR family regulator